MMNNAQNNPFILRPYVSKEFFCDRKQEMNDIIRFLENGANVSLITMRRIGKTGLILRTFDELRTKKYGYRTIYADIYSTQNVDDFVSTLASAVVAQTKESGIKAFFSILGGIRPLISYDPVSGQPQVSVIFQNDAQRFSTIESIFDYLENLGEKVVVAIDEFQQIREYENVNMEGFLRSKIQHLKNVSFIFSGSDKRLMTDMFEGEKSPFYQSVTNVPLGKIDSQIYASFITKLFEKGGKHIEKSSVDYILKWSRCHTLYTQTLCNFTYMLSDTEVTIEDVYKAIDLIFRTEADKFYTIRAMLTKGQWKYLECVAKEGILRQPTSGKFLNKYDLGTAASSKRMLKSLLDKELLYETRTDNGSEYCVYNVFLSRWLERL